MMRVLFLIFMLSMSQRTSAQLTSAEYRREVVEYSWDLKSAENLSEAAQQSVALALTARLPELSASGSYSYRFRKYDGQKDWAMAFEPRFIQSLYAGGVVNAQVDEAKLNNDIALCNEEYTLLEVCYAADYAYWSLWAMGQYWAATKQYVEMIRSQAEAIGRRYSEGYTSKGDLLMMSSRLSEAEYELISAEQSRLTSLHNLNILRGFSVEEPVSLLAVSPDSLYMPRRVTRDELFAHRPDLAASRLDEEVARAATRVVKGGYNPQLSAGVGGSWRSYTPNYTGDTYFDGSLFIELALPIYHFGARRKAVAVSRSAERTKEITTELLVDEIVKEESNAWTTVVESRAQMSAATRSLNIASENLEISTYSYNEGLVSIVDLMTAQISWMQLYTNAINSEYSYQLALASYQKVVGRVE